MIDSAGGVGVGVEHYPWWKIIPKIPVDEKATL
jgi:hypothetical protein